MPWNGASFCLLLVGREGVEAATLIAALSTVESGLTLAASATGGVILAVVIAILWGRYGARVNVGLLFRITGIFLSLFAVQLVVYAFHEFSEANALPGSTMCTGMQRPRSMGRMANMECG